MLCPICNVNLIEHSGGNTTIVPVNTADSLFPEKIMVTMIVMYSCDICGLRLETLSNKDYLSA
jgi:hypothetical protein